ncbi:MAG: DUF3224 domain-containing protein [Terracidiphilus sp.]|jgi:hypothetical protein
MGATFAEIGVSRRLNFIEKDADQARRAILKSDPMLFVTSIFLGLALIAPQAAQPQKEALMPHHAHGTFTVDIHPLTPAPAEGLGRFSIDKQIHGDLEATSKGEMFSAGDPKQGAAGYVAIEMVTGTLDGKHGSFALQHLGTMDASGLKMQVIVVPGSGTGELKGIAGTFTIHNDKGAHSYDFDYTLPE